MLFPLILVLAILVRLPLLGGSLWLDEAAQAIESARPFAQQYYIPADFQPPLYHYIVHMLMSVSKAEWWLRLASLVPGIATVAVVYRLVMHRTGSSKKAALSALLLATSSFHIFFSQELRPYALAAFFACLSWYVLLRWVEDHTRRSLFLFCCLTLAGFYTMYLYPFATVSQVLFIGREHKKELRQLVITLIVTLIGFLPWLPFFIQQLQTGTTLTADLPGWTSVVAIPQLKALPLTLAKFLVGQVELRDMPALLPFFALILGGMLCILWQRWQSPKDRFLVYWGIVPLLLAWLVSFVVPVIAPKRLLFILPALLCALAMGATEKHTKRWLHWVVLAFLVVQILTWGITLRTPAYQREDWKGVIRIVVDRSRTTPSRALFAFPNPLAPWEWYAPRTFPVTTTRTIYVANPEGLRTFTDVSEPQIFVFDYLRDLTDPNRTIDAWLIEQGYTQTLPIDGGVAGFVRVYQR